MRDKSRGFVLGAGHGEPALWGGLDGGGVTSNARHTACPTAHVAMRGSAARAQNSPPRAPLYCVGGILHRNATRKRTAHTHEHIKEM